MKHKGSYVDGYVIRIEIEEMMSLDPPAVTTRACIRTWFNSFPFVKSITEYKKDAMGAANTSSALYSSNIESTAEIVMNQI